MTIQFLSPSETSRRLGVSVRALRLYERRGLVTPQRTSTGWRVYGPDQIARLHQVLALKGLGLPLTGIAELIAGGLASLDAVLALQEQVLGARRDQMERALVAVRSARARLASGQTLSLDDLTNLTRETNMTDEMTPDEWRENFDPLWRKHLSPQEYDAMLAGKMAVVEELGPELKAFSTAWEKVLADAKDLMARDDFRSAEAREVYERWLKLANTFTRGDPTLNAKSAAIWREALSDPSLEPRLPVKRDLWDFMHKVAAAPRA